jgi:hypothetical protein
MADRHCHGILVIPVSPLFASVLRQSPYYSKLTTTSTFSVLILLIAETDNSSRFFRVLFFSLLISLFTSFAMLSISSLNDDIDDVDESDDAVEFDDDEERFDVLFRAFMSSSTVP